MTVSVVAKRLGVCAATVYKLCATDALEKRKPHYDLGTIKASFDVR